jgi:phenylacetate-coenzyme A ligase PaaK-like adenylate-forming protein
VKQLNAWQPDRLVGYASIVQELAAEALDGRLAVRLNRVSTNSEPLLPEARDLALQAWGINIHDTWGSVEIGVAASEGESFAGLSLAEDFLIFEAVDAQGRPTADSALTERVLVTKLFGEAMPMIRYEMTDALMLDDSPNPDVPGCRRIHGIKGRSDAWFVYRGNIRIHPMIFRDALGQEPHISEYQVQQTAGGAKVLTVAHGAFDAAALAKMVEGSLAAAGFPGAAVSIELVNELPRHAETNKLVRFVPLRKS